MKSNKFFILTLMLITIFLISLGEAKAVCTTPTTNQTFNFNESKEICGGTYTNVSIFFNQSSTSAYLNCSGECIFDGYGLNRGIDTNFKNNVNVSGLTFKNYTTIMYTSGSQNMSIYNNILIVNKDTGSGINLRSSKGSLVYNNVFMNSSGTSGYYIRLENYNNTRIYNNSFITNYSLKVNDLYLIQVNTGATNISIYNNTFSGAKYGIGQLTATSYLDYSLIENNTISLTGLQGINGIRNSTIRNNYCYYNYHNCITSSSNNLITNNIMVMNETGHHHIDSGSNDTITYNNFSFDTANYNRTDGDGQGVYFDNVVNQTNTIISYNNFYNGQFYLINQDHNKVINLTISYNNFTGVNSLYECLYIQNVIGVENKTRVYNNNFNCSKAVLDKGQYNDYYNNNYTNTNNFFNILSGSWTNISLNEPTTNRLFINFSGDSNNKNVTLNYSYVGNKQLNLTFSTLNIFNQVLVYPFNDVKLNGVFYATDINNATYTLNSGDQLEILDGGCSKIPVDNLNVNESMTLCSGTYQLNDTNALSRIGALAINSSNIVLICNNTQILAYNNNTNNKGLTMNNFRNVTVIGCNVTGFDYGIDFHWNNLIERDIRLINISAYNNNLNVYIGGINNTYIENLKAFDSRFSHGLYLDVGQSKMDNVTVVNSDFYNNSNTGIQINCGSSVQRMRYTNISNNKIYNNGFRRGAPGFNDLCAESGYFYNNNLTSNYWGVAIAGNQETLNESAINNSYYNNIFYNNTQNVFHFKISNNASSNRIYNNTYLDGYAYLATSSLSVSDNYVYETITNLTMRYTNLTNDAYVYYVYSGKKEFNMSQTNIIKLFNQALVYPFNDVYNVSSSSILQSNINNYSITLTSGQQIIIGNVVHGGLGCFNTSINLTIPYYDNTPICVYAKGNTVYINFTGFYSGNPYNDLKLIQSGVVEYRNFNNVVYTLPNTFGIITGDFGESILTSPPIDSNTLAECQSTVGAMIVSFGEIPSWLTIMLAILAASIIIGLLLMAQGELDLSFSSGMFMIPIVAVLLSGFIFVIGIIILSAVC